MNKVAAAKILDISRAVRNKNGHLSSARNTAHVKHSTAGKKEEHKARTYEGDLQLRRGIPDTVELRVVQKLFSSCPGTM